MNAAPPLLRAPASSAGHSIRDVARLTGLGVPRVLGFVHAGSVMPRRGPRGEYRFSFQDLVVLRTAQGLLEKVSSRKLHRALRRLRRQLHYGRSLATVRIACEGDELVVREGAVSWEAESGQARMNFETPGTPDTSATLEPPADEDVHPSEGDSAEEWYRLGCQLEMSTPARARDAYRRALEIDPDHPDARLNLGRLLHEDGQPTEAEACYRRVLALCPEDATAAFNLGVALEDLDRTPEAVGCYEQALAADPGYADAHFNLAHLHERLGHRHAALRHLTAYRRLTGHGHTPDPRS